MRVALLTANLGRFDTLQPFPDQTGVEVDFHPFTDAVMTPRVRAMAPRLQAKIPKMFGWDLRPGYDAYVWLDASLTPSKPETVSWFVEQLGDRDVAVFRHPWRHSAREEADYLRTKMANGSHYLKVRYEGEDLNGQMAALQSDGYPDDVFYAGGAFCYRPTWRMKGALKEWWYHTTRFHCIDQLAWAFVLWQARSDVHVIDEDIYQASHLKWTRGKGHG